MNNRIKQLSLEAGAGDWGDSVIPAMMDIEKFAELIVRECARVYWNIDDGETHTEYVKALKEHFGVAE